MVESIDDSQINSNREEAPKPRRAMSTKEFLSKAMDRWRLAAEAEEELRKDALDDLRFAAGEQWPDAIKRDRDADNRPCLVVNRLPQVINQVANEQRQSRPQSQISPVGNGATKETAEILEGLNRHIDSNSDSDVATDNAFECMCRMGFGYFRFTTEYVNDESFDQEIRWKRILNPFTVYFDPSANEPDYSDANYCFIVEDCSREAFEMDHPDADVASLADMVSTGDVAMEWASEETVRKAEYFYVEQEDDELCLLANGNTVLASKLKPGAKVKRRRPIMRRIVKWALITATEILDEREWPGKWIPVIPVLGTELIVEGRRHLIGIVRFAKDPQRMLNYWVSAQTEMIALAPKSPFVAAEGQLEGYESIYQQANSRNLAYLPYKAKAIGNMLLPPPQRQTVEPPIQAISVAIAQSSEDIKSTTGLYDDSLGKTNSDKSGKAILARQQQGNTANLHLSDNLTRSIRHAGRVKLDLIPHIYDSARVIHIVNPDQSRKAVVVNQHFNEGTPDAPIERIYDLTVGTYDVAVTVGPTYATRRQEAVQSMLGLVQADPDVMKVCGDLIVKNMDWPDSDAVAERLHKMLPPQLQDQDPNQAPLPPAVQQRLAQSGQMIQKLSQTVHALQDQIDAKTVESQSRERIAAMQEETKRTIALATLDQKDGISKLMEELDMLKSKHALIAGAVQQQAAQSHEAALQQGQQAHEQQMSQQAAQQQAAQQQAAQQHDAALQQQGQDHEADMATQAQGAQADQQAQQLAAQQQQQTNQPRKAA